MLLQVKYDENTIKVIGGQKLKPAMIIGYNQVLKPNAIEPKIYYFF